MTPLVSTNPHDGSLIQKYLPSPEAHVTDALAELDHAAQVWRSTPFQRRADCLKRVASHLLAKRDEYARCATLEMGKPIAQSRAEIEKCAWACEHYADHAETLLRPDEVPTEARQSGVVYEPLGTILAVMPWNFPFWQLFRFAAPALMAGNVALLKHASNVSGCALAIEDSFRAGGFPVTTLCTLLLPSKRIGALIDDPRIRGVTLTGSREAGRSIAAAAGAALKKIVLELGGSDPYLVLEDADVDAAAEICARSRLINSGQSCIAAKRFIVHRDRHDRFVDRRAHASREGGQSARRGERRGTAGAVRSARVSRSAVCATRGTGASSGSRA